MRLSIPAVLAVSLLAACDGGGGGSTPPPIGPADCDPAAQTGCGSGQKCTWIRVDAGQGTLGCVPAGAQAVEESCSYGALGEQTGYDDCAGGMICLAGEGGGATGTCAEICGLTEAGGCGATGACQAYVGHFEDGGGYGICEPACDPNTQVRLTDGAEACGSADPAAPALGCYGELAHGARPTTFTCAPAGDAENTHRVPATTSGSGGAYVNGCAPGYLPLLVESTGSSTVVCIALCTPVESHEGNADGLLGAAPHRCPDRLATGAGEECRFLSWLEDPAAPVTSLASGVGFCFDHTRYTWDHDQDQDTPPVQTPSCAALPNVDTDDDGIAEHAEWGCAPRAEE